MARNKTSKPITLGSLFKDALSFLFFPVGVLATAGTATVTLAAEGYNIVKAYFVKNVIGREVKYEPFADSIYRAFKSIYNKTASFTFGFITDTSKEVFRSSGEGLAENNHLVSTTQKQKDASRIIKDPEVLNDAAKKPNTTISPISAEQFSNTNTTARAP